MDPVGEGPGEARGDARGGGVAVARKRALSVLFGLLIAATGVGAPAYGAAPDPARASLTRTTGLADDTVNPRSGDRLLRHPTTASRPGGFAAAGAIGLYDVVVVGIPTAAGPTPATQSTSASMIEALDAGYSSATGGKFRFRLQRFVTAPFNGGAQCDFNVVDSAARSAAGPLTTTAGALDVLLVGVTAQESCSYAGMASVGAAGMHINGYWDSTNVVDVKVLGHETGHNLGLRHANSLSASPLSDKASWVSGEYEDTSDVMGVGIAVPSHLRFNGAHLRELGLVPAGELGVVSSQTVTIKPLYGGGGIRVVLLPTNNVNAIELDYRPAVGDDSDLVGSGRNYPGAGVSLRSIRAYGKSSDWDPAGSGGDTFSLITNGGSGYQSGFTLTDGVAYSLPDGSTATVVSEDPVVGAVVQITRPTDASAPTATSDPFSYDATNCTPSLCTPTSFPQGVAMSVGFATPADNRWVSEVRVEDNGVSIRSMTAVPGVSAPLTYGQFQWVPTGGSHRFVLVAIDSAGNRTTLRSADFVVLSDNPPVVAVRDVRLKVGAVAYSRRGSIPVLRAPSLVSVATSDDHASTCPSPYVVVSGTRALARWGYQTVGRQLPFGRSPVSVYARDCANKFRSAATSVVLASRDAVGRSAVRSRGWSSLPVSSTGRRLARVGKPGASLTWRANARSVGVVMRFGPTCTRVRVYVDGVYRYSVNTRASKYSYRVIWAQSWTARGRHMVTLRHAGSSGRYIDVDRLLYV